MTATAIVRACLKTTGRLLSGRTLCMIERSTVSSVQPLKLFSNQQHRFLTTKAGVDLEIKKYEEGDFHTVLNPDKLVHFRRHAVEVEEKDEVPPVGTHAMPHRIWTEAEVKDVAITHRPPEGFVDKAAYFTVQAMRNMFDLISGFKYGERNEHKWLERIIFLETVAGVPGMVAAMTRHLHSLRRLRRDYGWIHTLLEEAENERMHLMTALHLRHPSRLFKWCVIGAQGVFVGMFSLSYLISPRFCHRFVGYLEEEAVKTYTKCLEDIEIGCMQHWNVQPSPQVAIDYWELPEDAVMKDVILAIRADEAHHRVVNHTLASMKPTDYNPYKPGE